MQNYIKYLTAVVSFLFGGNDASIKMSDVNPTRRDIMIQHKNFFMCSERRINEFKTMLYKLSTSKSWPTTIVKDWSVSKNHLLIHIIIPKEELR